MRKDILIVEICTEEKGLKVMWAEMRNTPILLLPNSTYFQQSAGNAYNEVPEILPVCNKLLVPVLISSLQ